MVSSASELTAPKASSKGSTTGTDSSDEMRGFLTDFESSGSAR
ncbi:hypothetical protein PC121_g5955 [Phytophthora cactorum]|nr:hypothetical protein PC120_g16453 [Phytophthora cactorum]KAG3082852.1 hypothetical protein PC121_g5955 [Phytophthora cactorum]